MKVAVIGAGVAGLTTAHELARKNIETTVLDGGEVGQQASAGNAGWVTPYLSTPRAAPGVVGDAVKMLLNPNGAARIRPHVEPSFASWALRFLRSSQQRHHRQNDAALRKLGSHALSDFDRLTDSNVVFEQHRKGLSIVAMKQESFESLQASVPHARRLGYKGEIQTFQGRAISEFDPAISRNAAGVVHLVNERHVNPESLTSGLAKSITAHGGEIVTGDAVVKIEQKHDMWSIATQSGATYQANRIVVAAGFHSKSILQSLGLRIPMEAASGTSMTAVGEGTKPIHALKLFESMVACSPFESDVRLSGTYDVGNRSVKVDKKRLKNVVESGLEYLHDWSPTQVKREWAGIRPTTPDDMPIVGPVKSHPGLYLNTGHGTLGVTLGPTTGRLLARTIMDERADADLFPFRPQRFRSLR